MPLKEQRRPFFAWTSLLGGRSAGPSQDPTDVPQITEPSPELRHAVHRHRRGLQVHSRHGADPAPGRPVSYTATASHRRASARGGLASSDAMIVTRFILQEAEPGFASLLGRQVEGRSVLDFDLGGLELAWHKDLMLALEERAAIWSVSRIAHAGSHHLIEHLVIPTPAADGQATLVGWFNPIGESPVQSGDWSDIHFVGRERRAQRISPELSGVRPVGKAATDAEHPPRRDLLSLYRSSGAI